MDMRSRSVSDWLWISFGIVAAIFYLIDPPYPDTLPGIALSVAVSGILSFVIHKAGLFGGADALAIFTLALLMPQYSGQFSVQSGGSPSPMFPVSVLTNALALSTLQIVANVARNATAYFRDREALFLGFDGETTARKAAAFMIGFKSASPLFCFSIEKKVGSAKRFDFELKNAEAAVYEPGKDVWVTPSLPLLIYLLAGFIVAILAGDLAGLVYRYAL